MSQIAKEVIKNLINSNLVITPTTETKCYIVETKISEIYEVLNLETSTRSFTVSGNCILLEEVRKCLPVKGGTVYAHSTSKVLKFYVQDNDSVSAQRRVLQYIKTNYEESVAKYQQTQMRQYADNANNLATLYRTLGNKLQRKVG